MIYSTAGQQEFVTRVTWWVPLVEQEPLTLVEYLSSPLVFSGICVTRSWLFCVVFCRSLFVLLSFFLWPLYCLPFDLWLLITPLVFSNFFCRHVQISYLRRSMKTKQVGKNLQIWAPEQTNEIWTIQNDAHIITLYSKNNEKHKLKCSVLISLKRQMYGRFKSTLGLMLICCLCIYIPTK